MAFQIKDFASIVAAQVNHARAVTEKVTDFQPGSVVRTLMEAPAVEIEELYMQFFLGLRDAIPVATFLSFGFDLLPAAHAAGFVSVSSSTPLTEAMTIPAGASFAAEDGRVYTSTAAVIWPMGSSLVQVPVAHTSPGVVGNVSAGGITSSDFFGAGYAISNQPIETGRDAETSDERNVRFAEYVQSLSRGTVAACEYAAKQARIVDSMGNTTEYVTKSGIHEQPGMVIIYVYSSYGLPTADLVQRAQAIIDGSKDAAGVVTPGYRPAGVRVSVQAMQEREVPLVIFVSMMDGFVLDSSVEQDISDIFDAKLRELSPGETLHLGTLVEHLLSADGVKKIVPQSSENIVCAVNEALVSGAVTVSLL